MKFFRKRISQLVVLCCVLPILFVALKGYVVLTVDGFQHPVWKGPVPLNLWSEFTDQLPNVVEGSDPRAAIVEALERWAGVGDLVIVMGESSDAVEAGADGFSIITLADNQENRNLVGSLAGVSARSWDTQTLRLFDTDVVFNPDLTWSTIETDDNEVTGIHQVAVHEFGHSMNLGHTISQSAAMFNAGSGFDFGFTSLAWDDVAGINVSYPLPGMDRITGSMRGVVTRDGAPIFGAFVVAVDEFGMLAGSALSLPDGSYEIGSIPPGSYTVYVEPLDGLTSPEDFTASFFIPGTMTTDFLPRFYQDSLLPNVEVEAGTVTDHIDIDVEPGSVEVLPGWIQGSSDPFSRRVPPFAAGLRKGVNVFSAIGLKTDELNDEDGMFLSGDRLQVGPSVDKGDFFGGLKFNFFPLILDPDAPRGDYSVFFRRGESITMLSGGIKVFSPWRFSQTFAQVIEAGETASSTIFLVNRDLQNSLRGVYQGRDGQGRQVSLGRQESEGEVSLPPGGSVFLSGSSTDGFIGSVQAEADRPFAGAALIETAFGTTGVGASAPLFSFIAPVEKQGSSLNTGLAITNLEDRPVQILLQLQDKEGQAVGSRKIEMAPNGHTAQFVDQFIEGLPDTFLGTLHAGANRKVAATVVRTSPGGFTTFPVVRKRVLPQGFFSQFVHGGDFTSRLILVNPSASFSSEVEVRIRNSDGSPAAVTLNDELLPQGLKNVVIPPLGCVILESGGETPVVGSVEIFSIVPVGGVVLFSSPTLGTAAVGEGRPLQAQILPIDRDLSNGSDTGIALLNTASEETRVTLTVRNTEGEIVAGPKEVVLPAKGQISRFPNEEPFSLSLSDLFSGSVWLASDGPIAATVVRQSPGVLTTFPAIAQNGPVAPILIEE